MNDRIVTDLPPIPPILTASASHVRRSVGRALLVEARPKHWIKNGVLFAGIVFAKQLTQLSALWHTLAAFVLFSLVASAIYFLNDLRDRAADRLHPKKRFR
ncbi:MAG: decaprenyl-phosphate phosphoribosyltransferase, partial [Chloroflexota bacterium]|nr:decaprenyl-phosphate phosphoribosyltransferase [Chloroflexota bacterium]